MTDNDRPGSWEGYEAAGGECYACMVGVATGPESHAPWCGVKHIPMPEQTGQWGDEWREYDTKVRRHKQRAWDEFVATEPEF